MFRAGDFTVNCFLFIGLTARIKKKDYFSVYLIVFKLPIVFDM